MEETSAPRVVRIQVEHLVDRGEYRVPQPTGHLVGDVHDRDALPAHAAPLHVNQVDKDRSFDGPGRPGTDADPDADPDAWLVGAVLDDEGSPVSDSDDATVNVRKESGTLYIDVHDIAGEDNATVPHDLEAVSPEKVVDLEATGVEPCLEPKDIAGSQLWY